MTLYTLADIEIGSGFTRDGQSYIKLDKNGVWEDNGALALYFLCYDFIGKKTKYIKAEDGVIPISVFVQVG